MKAPDTFAQATDSLYEILSQRGWPRSVRWLGPKDLRVRQTHVILRSGANSDGARIAEARYTSALDMRATIRICVPARTAGLVFSFVIAEPARSMPAPASQLLIQFWDFNSQRAHAVTHRHVHWRLRDAALDLDFRHALERHGC